MPNFSGSGTGHISAVSLPTYYISMVLVNGEVYKLDKNEQLFSPDDPDKVVLNPDGSAYTLLQARASGAVVSDIFSDVSWRTPFGSEVQHPQGAISLIDALKESAPYALTLTRQVSKTQAR